MKYPYSRAVHGLLALSASVFLVACGSGNNISPAGAGAPPTSSGVNIVAGTDVPVAATLDAGAAFEFVSSVVAKGEANSDTPLVLGDTELAVSDTADAMPLAA
jgi:hypothetical protein